MQRVARITVYVSPSELAKLRLAAAHSSESLSEYVRRAALAVATRKQIGEGKNRSNYREGDTLLSRLDRRAE